jgi:integrase
MSAVDGSTNTTVLKAGMRTKTVTPCTTSSQLVNNNNNNPHSIIVHSDSKNNSNDDVLFDRKVEIASEGLISCYSRCFYKIPLKENALTLASYVTSMKSEINLSNSYRREVIQKLSRLSIYHGKTLFKDMTREQILDFLDTLRKPEASDPLHKWTGTYNMYRMYIVRFFKWLYHHDIEAQKRPKPSVIENIPQLKRKEISIYKPSDLWTNEDDAIFLCYCPSKRIKCYHAVSRDTSCRPHEILKLRIKDIAFKTIASNDNNYQYAEMLVNGKTGSRYLPLINSIPYVKDWLDHEHPQPSNPNGIFLCGFGKSLGRALQTSSLRQVYEKYKQELFPKLLESPNVPPEDKSLTATSSITTTITAITTLAFSPTVTAISSSRRSIRFLGISIHTDSHIAFENTCRR